MSIDKFTDRHIGPGRKETEEMLKAVGVNSLDELIDQTIPASIRTSKPLSIDEGMSEYDYLKRIREIGSKNRQFRSFIGMGYYNTIFPSVIKRNILENPSWYTSYTPYQAEISQGRLEALLNFQTMVMDLTSMEIANASLLDESTAASEAMIMMMNLRSRKAAREGVNKFFVDENIFPQTLAVLESKAKPLKIELVQGKYENFVSDGKFFGSIIQYPDSIGNINDYRSFVEAAHNEGMLVGVAADLLALAILAPPGEWGADVVFGSSQRFGIPLGYGGPHAAYFATREKFKRSVPGRIIGVSVDRHNEPALRMALQTREQHIKREKATSNICTAQALLATMAGMYAIYHGPENLKNIARHAHSAARILREKLQSAGYEIINDTYFDTLTIKLPSKTTPKEIRAIAEENEINFAYHDDDTISISTDETISIEDINNILSIFIKANGKSIENLDKIELKTDVPGWAVRESAFMEADVFHKYRSETELMRYMKKLEKRDFSLTHSMISLGSCTMKLNPASSLMAFMWPEFSDIHPFVPFNQAQGYFTLFNELKEDLRKITGFSDISFQPNSGAAGEYTGLMVIRAYHESRGESHRNIVLIPASAHGTNPASAVMAGMKVVVVDCDNKGNVNLECLRELASNYKDNLAGFMITYPSTHGVFEEDVREMIGVIHEFGGQVYMDGANMNAQVGITNPAIVGADVCHLNLHKTFAIPHGGGGPGVGPIGVADHLVDFLPGHPVMPAGGVRTFGSISAAPFGSASILTISHAYIKMLGAEGLTESTKIAILNANYLATRLSDKFQILYKGKKGRVGHEMILECRTFKQRAGISEADIAKRLIDYGFHAPTLSFPVHGTLMVEPTESESLDELNRFIFALEGIYREIEEIEEGKADKEDNVLRNAPHTAAECVSNEWNHEYDREKAAYPKDWIRDNKFWPAVARVDDAYGDRNLICSCLPLEAYAEA
jgi:glycine dehydrogenase